jgi:integrase
MNQTGLYLGIMELAVAQEMNNTNANARDVLNAILNYTDNHPLATVTHQRGKGYKKCIGRYLGDDGKMRPKIFWLGHDEQFARRSATILQSLHELLTDQERQHWTPDTLKRADEFVSCLRRGRDQFLSAVHSYLDREGRQVPKVEKLLPMPANEETSPISSRKPLTLDQGVANYTSVIRARVPNLLSKKNCDRQVTSLKLLHDVLPGVTPLSDIGKMELEKLVAHFAGRPVLKAKGTAMAVDTVITTLQHMRQFFDWLDGDDWEAPRRMDKIFRRVRRNTLMTPEEQRSSAKGNDTHTYEELRTIYARANDRQKLYMLLALNCAFTQGDIATLLEDDVIDGGRIIDRIRHKTRRRGVRGRWELWPELTSLLNSAMASTPRDRSINLNRLALLTSENYPLVHDDTDSDAIAQSWSDLLAAINKDKVIVRPLSFKYLRKTAGTAIRRISKSKDIRSLMLAHARQGVGELHYDGETDFAPLVGPLRKFRLDLVTAGVFGKTEKKKAA